MNLLTNEMQCAYKTKRSTQDIIHFIKTKLTKHNINGQILIDLSKAFGKIDRNKLWWILYKKGLPLKLIKALVGGHTNTTLRSKHDGKLGPYIANNVGVFQGSPISAQLFAIYIDSTMENYQNELNKQNITQKTYQARNYTAEQDWARSQLPDENDIEENRKQIFTNNDNLENAKRATHFSQTIRTWT